MKVLNLVVLQPYVPSRVGKFPSWVENVNFVNLVWYSMNFLTFLFVEQPFEFSFELKFYPPVPENLNEDLTR